jgi:hypothetical protein
MGTDGAGADLFKAEKTYEGMVIEALMLSDRVASGMGGLEGVIDSLWAAIPSEKKVMQDVYTADYAHKKSAVLEWQNTELMVPKADLPDGQRLTDPINRKRILRKKQILVDTLAAMGIMYRDIQESAMLLE